MASPPARSPPGPSSLALPRARPQPPTLALPSKSRKSSLAPSTGSAHPLRQTSFPPPDSLEAQHQAAEDNALNAFSPTADDDDFSDSEITSAISGNFGEDALNGGKKRKRGPEKKAGRGRPGKQNSVRMGSVSIVNGDDNRSATGGKGRGGTTAAQSVVTGDGDEDAEDDDDDAGAAEETVALSAKELEDENQRKYLFRETVKADHQRRYDVYNRVRINKSEVRKLVNATLSQSVPPNVVMVVQAYAKMFAGMLIEGARDVQSEWMAAQPTRPDEGENRAYKRLRMMQPEEVEDEDEDEGEDEVEDMGKGVKTEEDGQQAPNGIVKVEKTHVDSLPNGTASQQDTQPQPSSSTQTNGDSTKDDEADEVFNFENAQPGAWGLSKFLEEPDRGPLLPDHLRESLRRYKKSRSGGTVGFTGISLGRTDVVAPRMGGKRLFR